MLFKSKKKDDAGSGDSAADTTPGASLDKAQLRRAQVRKAQIQHRQRKANYVKTLEIDVARIRELISNTQRETKLLKRENDAIRAQIQARPPPPAVFAIPAIPITSSSSPSPGDPFSMVSDTGNVDLSSGYIPSLQDLEDITMTLTFDDIMSAPSFRVSSSPSDSRYEASNQSLYSSDATSPALSDTTPDQTQEAINFILALEHICRNHFHPSIFQPELDNPGRRASGHTLMATSLALRTAPESVFQAASRCSPLLRRAQPSDVPSGPESEAAVSWPAAGLTLHSLYGLACSISSADVELTPVQAWFDLAARYPLALLLQRDVLDTLKRELAPVVRCPHFGAQMERTAYESVVGRVLDPAMVVFTAAASGPAIEG